MTQLQGRTAVVTGGGRGIGRGIALELARAGADIAIADIDLPNAEKTAAELRELGRRATVVEVDVASEESARAGVERALAEHGAIDILVNNAGVSGGHVGAEIALEDWDACYEVNLKGIWIMTRAVVPHFRDRGGGKVVNIASIAGRRGSPVLAHYCASKAGAISLTQSLARELGAANVNVNAVCPGLLWTDMWRGLESMMTGAATPEAVEARRVFDAFIESNCPLQREQTPEDIGQAVVFLASDAARNITGQALNVDGGIELN